MRYVKSLLLPIREMSNNQEFSQDSSGATLSGIPDSLILEVVNDAQDFLQAAIIAEYPSEFTSDYVFNISAGVGEYQVNDNVFINNKILSVEYSFNGDDQNYEPIYPRTVLERTSRQHAYVSYYIRYGGTILLQPIPANTQGKVRVKFYRELDDLDIRRGTVTGTPTIVGTNLQSFTLASDSILDINTISAAEYLCVCNSHGVPLMYNIPVASFNTGTLLVTVEGGFTFKTGETIPSGAYVTNGQYSTTHSKLSKNCERFLKIYAQKRLMNKDQSAAAVEETEEVKMHLQSILDVYADITDDVMNIPVNDFDITV